MSGDPLEPLDAEAERLDAEDPVAAFRARFAIPTDEHGRERIYLAGNSLGLKPLDADRVVGEELQKWAEQGVRGHFSDPRPWVSYHELFSEPMARLVGAHTEEVVVMNSLTTNLHLLFASFYRPTADRYKILIEEHAFPSDTYAVASQAAHHGFDPSEAVVTVAPRRGESVLRLEDVVDAIERHGDSLSIVWWPGVQYYTGQVFDAAAITAAAHRVGAMAGFDLAHSAGNVQVHLHDSDADFAVWCTYKYLNGGPGATGAAFVHARHLGRPELPRLSGWWGHDKQTRFRMGDRFVPIPTAEAWQLSNAPVMSMAPLVASLGIFDSAGGLAALRPKAESMSAFAERALARYLGDAVSVITPGSASERGCQLSLEVAGGRATFERLEAEGVDCDWRHPNVVRIAPVPLYNRYADVARFVRVLAETV